MNDDTSSRRLGRRMDKLLVERRLLFWTHIVLGFLSGSAFVGAATISLARAFPETARGFTAEAAV